VDLLKRSPRGVTPHCGGKNCFLEKTRHLLRLADESVEQVRALARGQFGELHIGYSPSPTVEILPPALAAFQKGVSARQRSAPRPLHSANWPMDFSRAKGCPRSSRRTTGRCTALRTWMPAV